MTVHTHPVVVVLLLLGCIASAHYHFVHALLQQDEEDGCLDRFKAALAIGSQQARVWASRCDSSSSAGSMRLQLRSLFQQSSSTSLVLDSKNQTEFLLRVLAGAATSDRESSQRAVPVPVVPRPDPIGMDCQDHPPGSFRVGLWSKCCSTTDVGRNSPNGSTDSRSMVIDPGGTTLQTLAGGDDPCASFCCELHELSTAALYLPLLDELTVRLRVNISMPGEETTTTTTAGRSTTTETFLIQQDGWLRPYDPSTVLWPTGYLLALCLAQPVRCGVIDTSTTTRTPPWRPPRTILEIGPGVGAALVVAARVFAPDTILAVDASTAALALVRDNLLLQQQTPTNSTMSSSSTRVILHHATIGTDAVCDRSFGYVDMVLVSSVPVLLQQKTHLLESLLDCWLDSSNGGVAVIAYSVEQPPPLLITDNNYYDHEIVSARQLGLRTRLSYTTTTSDDDDDDDDEFAIAILRKRQRRISSAETVQGATTTP